jgi:Polysaccharide deacetylase
MRLLAVNHHYYRIDAPGSGIYPITPAGLEAEIADLAKMWRIASQEELVRAIARPEDGPVPLCIITFDDGLKEQMAAARRLSGSGRGGIFFVSTAPLIERRVLDVHKLQMIRAVRTDEELAGLLEAQFGPTFSGFDLDGARQQYKYDNDHARRVKFFVNFMIDPDARREWSDRLFCELFGDEAAAAEQLYMSADDVRELARLGMLGTHGHGHIPLAELDAVAMKSDIQCSLDILAQCGAKDVRGISYPYGGPSAVSAVVARTAAECGLAYGFTMARGVNNTVDLANPFLLKRISTSDYADYCESPLADIQL